jgi:hypothetical protein
MRCNQSKVNYHPYAHPNREPAMPADTPFSAHSHLSVGPNSNLDSSRASRVARNRSLLLPTHHVSSTASQPYRASTKSPSHHSLRDSDSIYSQTLVGRRSTPTHYDDTSNSGAIRSATPSNFFFQPSSLSASFPICARDSTRGCTHVITAFWSTWSIEPRINLRLRPF